MKYKYIILTLLLLLAGNIFAQELGTDESSKYLKTYTKLDLGFSGLGISLETPLSRNILFEVAAGAGAGYKINEDFKYRMYFDNPAAFATVHAKYYHNLDKRVSRGRPVSYNAGNFFGVKVKYATPTLRDKKTWNTLLVGFHWGMQRKMAKYFMYQINVGVGGAIDVEGKTSTHLTLFPDVNFRVSYVLPFN